MIYVLVLIIGLLFGSFLNVCIYRIPRMEDIVYTPSHCMQCQKRIQWYDLFPVLSWVILRGKCRYCKTKVSIQYPIIELINGLAYVGIYMLTGLTVQTLVLFILFSTSLVITMIDYRFQIIPNGIVIFLGVVGLLNLILFTHQYVNSIIGFFAISVPLWVIHIVTGGNMGMGDVKLMAVCGLILGWQNIILALMIGSIAGSVIGLSLIAMKKMTRKQQIPFGPYLCLGIMIAALFGDVIIDAYLRVLLQ